MKNKKYTTAAVAVALNMSETSIKEKYGNASTLAFTQIVELSLDSKSKRYTDEAKEINAKLDGFAKMFN